MFRVPVSSDAGLAAEQHIEANFDDFFNNYRKQVLFLSGYSFSAEPRIIAQLFW